MTLPYSGTLIFVRCDALIMITGVSIYLGSSPRRRIPRRRKAPPINTLIAFHLPLCPHRQCKSPPFTSHSTHSSSSLSCLQGDSILHGLADIVCNIQSKLGPNERFPCSEPRTIAFSIGGKLFPVDMRDFIQQVSENNVVTCISRLGSMNLPVLTGH